MDGIWPIRLVLEFLDFFKLDKTPYHAYCKAVTDVGSCIFLDTYPKIKGLSRKVVLNLPTKKVFLLCEE